MKLLPTLAIALLAGSTVTMDPGWSTGETYNRPNVAVWFAPAGDVNGDGNGDFIVGVAGHVDVYYGGIEGVSWSAVGEAEGDLYGQVVAKAGDVDGDGYDDVVVGAPDAAGGLGRIYVYRGGQGGLSPAPAWTATGWEADPLYGGFAEMAVESAGDVDGDGRSEIIVGDWKVNHARGHAYVFKAGAGPVLELACEIDGADLLANSGDISTAGIVEDFGAAVSSAGDVNGDGYGDVIVGAPTQGAYGEMNDPRVQSRAYLFYGSSHGLSTTPAWSHSCVHQYALVDFGTFVASAGDMNGDGYDDVMVGAPGFRAPLVPGQPGEGDAGRVWLFYGSAEGLEKPSCPETWTANGPEFWQYYGWCAATAGDFNGDGHRDLVVPACNYKTYVYHGGADGRPSAAPTAVIDESAAYPGGLWWIWTCSAGDVNGDGREDLLVAARDGSHDGTDRSRGEIYYGTGNPTYNSKPRITTLGQRAGTQALSVGAVTADAVTLRANVRFPEGSKVQFELRDAGSAFLDQVTIESAILAAGAVAEVQPLLVADKNYHWQARIVPPGEAPGRWISFGSNPDAPAEVDFRYRSNEAPVAHGVAQVAGGTGTAIAVGRSIFDRVAVRFEAGTSDGHDDDVQLLVEVRPVGEAFLGIATHRSRIGRAGERLEIVAAMERGSYHWQWSLVDALGAGAGTWTSFGGNGEGSADFSVSDDGSTGTACSASAAVGRFAWVFVLLALLIRPRSR